MRVTKLEVMEHLKRLHAAHGIPEHHRGSGLELVTTEFYNALRWEDSGAVERAVDELCASDSRFFPKPGALVVVARKHRPVSTGPGLPATEGWPCPTCGEPFRFWVMQRDGGEFTRSLVRHKPGFPCARFVRGITFLGPAPDVSSEWDWRDILTAGKRGGEPQRIGDAA